MLTMIHLVGLPSIDPSAIIDFFFCEPDKVSYVAPRNAVREERTNGLWRIGRVDTLLTTVLSGTERQVERLGSLCFVQNGVTGKFQYFGHNFLREDSRELPLIIAIARGATKCVKILLDHRADPSSTMSAPAPAPHGRKSNNTRHTTAMELAASSPAIVSLLRTAMERAHLSQQ